VREHFQSASVLLRTYQEREEALLEAKEMKEGASGRKVLFEVWKPSGDRMILDKQVTSSADRVAHAVRSPNEYDPRPTRKTPD
jgi:hypothetical protein